MKPGRSTLSIPGLFSTSSGSRLRNEGLAANKAVYVALALKRSIRTKRRTLSGFDRTERSDQVSAQSDQRAQGPQPNGQAVPGDQQTEPGNTSFRSSRSRPASAR